MYRILIVEDEEAIRMGLVDLLEIEGYEIDVAIDGEQAMEKVKQRPPHLVILDLMLPRASGYEVCRYIRKSFPQIFVLMLTAKTEEINKIQGLEMGADDYVTKPFSVFELMARIKSMLRRIDHEKVSPVSVNVPDLLEFDDVRIDLENMRPFGPDSPSSCRRKNFKSSSIYLPEKVKWLLAKTYCRRSGGIP